MVSRSRRDVLRLGVGIIAGAGGVSAVSATERTDRFLVDTAGLSRGALKRADLDVVYDLDAVDVAVVEGPESEVEAVTSAYAPDTEAEFELPVERVTAAEGDADAHVEGTESATDEPYYPLQWDKQVQRVPEAHDVTRGEGTRVAVIDSGVAAGHPDLQHAVNAELSRNFTDDDYGAPGPWGGFHGTHVSGIVAADDRNETGVVGTAPGTEVVDCRVFSPGALASFADILAAVVYATGIDCDAANMSIGAYPIPRPGLGDFYGKLLNRTTTYANRNGTVLVVSAGNDAADLQHDGGVLSLPHEAAQAMSVSATGPVGFLWGDPGLRESPRSPAFYTNYGTNALDLGAPGGDADPDAIGTGVPWYLDLVYNAIAEPVFDGGGNGNGEGTGRRQSSDDPDATYGYGWVAGTSMAAPQVTGAVALVRSLRPDATAGEVEDLLEETASVPEGHEKRYYGAGFLNPLGAVRAADEG